MLPLHSEESGLQEYTDPFNPKTELKPESISNWNINPDLKPRCNITIGFYMGKGIQTLHNKNGKPFDFPFLWVVLDSNQ